MGDTESKAVGFVQWVKAYGFGLHQYPLKIYRWISFMPREGIIWSATLQLCSGLVAQS